jgi:hypothetical protein
MSGHVFISYCHKDRDYVEELANVLARAEMPLWFDYEIESGARFTRSFSGRSTSAQCLS